MMMVLFWSGIAWAAETGWISPMVLFWLLDETWIVYCSTGTCPRVFRIISYIEHVQFRQSFKLHLL